MTSLPRTARTFAFLAASAFLAACGVGGGSSSEATLSIALTDAASDEIASFTVDVTAIQLTERRGGVVSALAAPVNVDLVTLQELSQVVNVMTVPAGFYTAASVTIDFSSANCVLMNQTAPATLVDENGSPLTGPMTLPLSLLGAPMRALGGRHRLLELDFDLDQSLTVDSIANQVAVAPSIVVRFDRTDAKELIAMGSLVSVDMAARTALIDLKTLRGTFLRQVTFGFAANAIYQLDGVPFVGTNGFIAFATMAAGTWVQGYGAPDPAMNQIDVSYLEAGKGTWNGGSDILEGHVIGRSGTAGSDATLTVLGHSQDSTHSTFLFNTVFDVDVDFTDTKVVRRTSATAYDTDELNVGQAVRVFGTLTGTTMNATSMTSVVREQPTRLLGYSIGVPAGSLLDLDLDRVDLRPESDFSWAQGGTTPTDPNDVKVDVGGLANGLGIVNGTPVVARGYFTAVDDNGNDFVASSLVNRANAPSVLAIRDRLLGFTVVTTTSSSQIQFAITGSPGLFEYAVIDQGFVGVQNLPTSPTPTVVPAASTVVFIIRDAISGSIRVDLDFAAFSSALGGALGSGRRLADFHSIGKYDAATNTLEAAIATAVLR